MREVTLWSDFESEVVAGRYQLRKLVRSEGRYGWFETSFEDKPALISLIESLNDEASLLDRLKAAEKVRHPNLDAILETGTTTLKDTPVVYAVMEFTEENLEDVLRTRALSEEETRQVAESLLDALSAVHKNRLITGELEASSVLASGDTIKLRSDRLQTVAPNAAFEPLAAKDVQSLGNLLYRCLTQRSVKLDANDPSIQLLPRSIVPVVRNALSGQAKAEDLIAILRPPVQPAPPVTSAPVPRPVPEKIASPPEMPNERISAEDDVSPGERKKLHWVLAGAVVILLVIGFVLWSMVHPSRHADTAPVPVAAAPVPATAVPSAPPAAPPPSTTTTQPAVPPPVDSKANWRVVAYTYNQQDQAEHKAHTINARHSDLQAGVFSPKGDGAPYLVTLGGAMDRAAAFELRDKAIHEGLPSDTYAQNYRH